MGMIQQIKNLESDLRAVGSGLKSHEQPGSPWFERGTAYEICADRLKEILDKN